MAYTGSHTFFGKIAAMLKGEQTVSPLPKTLKSVVLGLAGGSIVLCSIGFEYLVSSGEQVDNALSFSIVLWVTSIPVAIEIVVTTTLALGSRALSSHGAIVCSLQAIETMAGMSVLCSDKTGILTKNKMEIQNEVPPYLVSPIDPTQILRYAAMASK